MKKAIITGITGQDGAYLAKLLLDNNYQVYGAYRRLSSLNFWRLEELCIKNHKNLHLVSLDLTDQSSIIRMIQLIRPDEIYNLAAQSFVGASFDQPIVTANITGLGCVYLLEAIRLIDTKIKFYQASTSEMFGFAQEIPQTEQTKFYPRSPYAIAKLYAHWMTVNYREAYKIFACSGILFNHESPLRGKEFVTRKITDGVAKIKLGKLDCLELGNIDAKRDWGFAGDYVKGMHLMLQVNKPDTYILATNRTETVRTFVKMAFNAVGINLEFVTDGEDEYGVEKYTNKIIVKTNKELYRPCEVDLLIGNPKKANELLGWQADCTLEELCKMMVLEDLRRNQA